MFIRFSCRYDPNRRVVLSVTVAYNENAKIEAHAEHDESVLILRMLGIKESHGVLIKKYGLYILYGLTQLPQLAS
jgi:hypothetical protein